MDEDNQERGKKRRFLGVWFECCRTYGRLYKNREGTEYYGRCPKCFRPVRVPINSESDNATNRRFFRGS